MTPDQRVDYFRSEMKGELARLEKELAGASETVRKRFEELGKRVDVMLRELRSL